ncbi:type II restriction endonuclease subunit M [Rhizobium leguminosarum]|uniref:type II restriction endonuclease subunit M n=1 Tax=Rhizobium leguminosarum TaxID=384 RepID=UPI00102F3F4C|nr:type II restriction endonuclease subunit M [Rhizobium leguminosarum]TBF62404.1 type II restriction endonuclease subunit M [Rhizobium leguminosarum]
MSIFIGLLNHQEKGQALIDQIESFRSGHPGKSTFERNTESFSAIDGAAFLYSMARPLLELAAKGQTLSTLGADARQGIGAATRYHRLWWEILPETIEQNGPQSWPFMAHGTPYSPFYKPSYFRFKWLQGGAEAKADICHRYPYLNGNYGFKIQAEEHYFLPGLAYGKRTTNFSVQVMPADHVFSFEGTVIATTSSRVEPWTLLGLLNSRPVAYWLSKVCAQHKAYNYVQALPVPDEFDSRLGELSRLGWSISRTIDQSNESSSAFLLPHVILSSLIGKNNEDLRERISKILEDIDDISFNLFGFNETERELAFESSDSFSDDIQNDESDDDADEETGNSDQVDQIDALLSWAVGVAFGRFDWRLATGERAVPPEPDPFDPLPAKSPGMLPGGAAPFHAHSSILVDDKGHPHDLPRLIEEVLTRVQTDVPGDVRRWLQRDFFSLHLKQYSKSRRKAPIYWPLSTISGSYTLWLYHPSLSSQTLYTAVNDFVEPKLKQVSRDAATLRDKGTTRTRDDEKAFEALQTLELELIELLNTLLHIAPTYRPNHDDGVQITAAPLSQLFLHKPWQKILKDTWAKLEKGDFDWAHLAIAYWPDRVREKCKTDKSLAIAHDLEGLYEPAPSIESGRKKKKGSEA